MLALTPAVGVLPASATPPPDLAAQFHPAKDDDDGGKVDAAESQELLYQWLDPRYARDERFELLGLTTYFCLLGAGLAVWRRRQIAAKGTGR